jgi:hypothetical protein
LLYQEASFIGKSERYVKKWLRKRATPYTGPLLGNLEEGSFTGDVRETVNERLMNAASLSLFLSLSMGAL